MFLRSLIGEEHDRTGDDGLAVADGLSATARVIAAAASSCCPGPVGEAEHRQPLGAQAEVEGHLVAGAGRPRSSNEQPYEMPCSAITGSNRANSESMVTDRGSPGRTGRRRLPVAGVVADHEHRRWLTASHRDHLLDGDAVAVVERALDVDVVVVDAGRLPALDGLGHVVRASA